MEVALKKNNANFEVDLNKLDVSQKDAVVSQESNVVIRASAGSGKTFTLINAIANHRFNYLNDRICAITYTRAARAEMEDRLRSMGIYDVEVTTIHVWARNLLKDFSIKYDFKIRVLEENDIKSILEELVEQYYRRKSRKIKVNIGILYNYITGNKTMEITDSYRGVLNSIENSYIKYKRDNVLYDFTDYPLYLYDVMTTYNEYIYNIDALFVDEFQDVDEVQFNTFERVLARKKMFIGDPWQSIFQFRNADGEVFNKLGDFSLYKLKYNYRSHQEIIDYASTVYQSLEGRYDEDIYISKVRTSKPSGIKCIRGPGGNVYIVNFCSNENVIKFKEMLNKNSMILCRTNKQVKAIRELGYTNVSTIHQAKGLEYDSVIVIDTPILNSEDLNIAYVALTRARDDLMVISLNFFMEMLNILSRTGGIR